MKPIRQFLAVPFYIAGFAVFVLSVAVDLAGAWVEGA